MQKSLERSAKCHVVWSLAKLAPFNTAYVGTIVGAVANSENYLMYAVQPSRFRRASVFFAFTLMALLFTPVRGRAQAVFAGQANRGMSMYTTFEGSNSSAGTIFDINTLLGYDLSPALGFDLGAPYYFVVPPAQRGVASTATGIGDFYLDGRATLESAVADYLPTATVTFPTGNTSKGLSTGHVTYDLDNHFEHEIGPWIPFLDVDVGNSLDNSGNRRFRRPRRPFITLGKVAQFKAGPEVRITERITLSADYYRVVPWGPQTVISSVVLPGKKGKTKNPKRVFQIVQTTKGGAALVKDDGLDASAAVKANRFLDVTVAFNRSDHYALNTVSFSLEFNITKMLSRSRM